MSRLIQSKRYAAGNICLILFTAFILTIFSGTVGPVNSAYAVNVETTFDTQTGGWGPGPGQPVQINEGDSLNLVLTNLPDPVTPVTYTSIFYKIYNNQTGAQIGPEREMTLSAVYDQVYGYVYSLVYNAVEVSNLLAGDYTVSFVAYGAPDLPTFDLVLKIIKPPEPPPGDDTPSGGGGPSAPPTSSQDYDPADTGGVSKVEVDNTTGTATVNIDTNYVSENLPQNSAFVFRPPAEVPTTREGGLRETSFVLDATLAEQAASANTDLVFDPGLGENNVPVTMPAGTMTEDVVASLAQTLGTTNFQLEVGVGTYTEQESQALASLAESGQTAASSVLNLTMTARNPETGQSVSLQVTVKVELGYVVIQSVALDNEVLTNRVIMELGGRTVVAEDRAAFAYEAKGVNEDKLGVYRLNETTKKWEYIGGKVNKDTKKVQADVPGFGKYAVFEYDKHFNDVPAGHWANTEIEIMAARHVVKGVDQAQTMFMPDSEVTRAQFYAMLIRSLRIKEDWTSAPVFTDVSQNWRGVAMAAYKAGLAGGYEDGTFRPDQPITREQIASILTRVLEMYKVDGNLTPEQIDTILEGFSDRNRISGYARESAAKAVNAGIIAGRTHLLFWRNFAPQDSATRAESCVMLMRTLKKIGEI